MDAEKHLVIANRDAFANRILLFLLFTGIAILVSLADRAPLDLESISSDINISQKFIYYWQGVVYRFFPGPFVYRVLVPYTYWALNQMTHMGLLTIDTWVKIILLIACQYGLLKYLLIFFEKIPSLLGVFIFNALLGYFLSFIKGPSIIETIDILNFLLLTLSLSAIYEEKHLYLSILLIIGLLNRETPIILMPIVFIYEWARSRKIRVSCYVLLISIVTFAGVRILIPSWAGTTWFNMDELGTNLLFQSRETVIGNFRLAVLLGPFVLLGLYRFSEHPQFLKIAVSVIPLLIVIHYLTGRIIESRLWMPLFPVLIPLVVDNLVKLNERESDQAKRS